METLTNTQPSCPGVALAEVPSRFPLSSPSSPAAPQAHRARAAVKRIRTQPESAGSPVPYPRAAQRGPPGAKNTGKGMRTTKSHPPSPGKAPSRPEQGRTQKSLSHLEIHAIPPIKTHTQSLAANTFTRHYAAYFRRIASSLNLLRPLKFLCGDTIMPKAPQNPH